LCRLTTLKRKLFKAFCSKGCNDEIWFADATMFTRVWMAKFFGQLPAIVIVLTIIRLPGPAFIRNTRRQGNAVFDTAHSASFC
jgi:hypothetical protein